MLLRVFIQFSCLVLQSDFASCCADILYLICQKNDNAQFVIKTVQVNVSCLTNCWSKRLIWDSPCVERFTPEPLISHYVSETLIGQCGLTVPLLSLTSPCPAKSNDVTFVAMVHSGASRNMPERGRGKDLVLCLGGHAKTPHTQRNRHVLCGDERHSLQGDLFSDQLNMVSARIVWPMNLNVLKRPPNIQLRKCQQQAVVL